MALSATVAGLRRATALRHRVQGKITREDMRAWAVKRRERTRHLIELGGLIVKAGLVELTDDDRVVMFGAFIEMAATLRSEDREQRLALWQRRGRRAFEKAERD